MGLINRTVRAIHVRPRLTIATLVGLALLLFLPDALSVPTRGLMAWDLGAGLYLLLAWTMMLRDNVETMRLRASQQDDGAAVVLVLTVVAAVASLAAIVVELLGVRALPAPTQTGRLALAAITIVCSWFLVHTAFALHYAHEFYGDRKRGGHSCLQFPGNTEPDYADFLYFAFVLGTTSQTSDVTIQSSSVRRLALAHGVIAFFFNTTLLALVINVAAGLT